VQRIDKHGGEPYEKTDEYIYFPNWPSWQLCFL
jgi:hypothetical protein